MRRWRQWKTTIKSIYCELRAQQKQVALIKMQIAKRKRRLSGISSVVTQSREGFRWSNFFHRATRKRRIAFLLPINSNLAFLGGTRSGLNFCCGLPAPTTKASAWSWPKLSYIIPFNIYYFGGIFFQISLICKLETSIGKKSNLQFFFFILAKEISPDFLLNDF